MWEITLFQGISRHFAAPVGVKNAFQECQSFLKYVLPVMEDTAKKDTTYLKTEILTEGHFFTHLLADGLWVCSLRSSFLFPFFPPRSFLWRLIGRSRLKCHPALLAQPHIVILFLSVCLCWYGRVTSGASSQKPHTKWLKSELLLLSKG